jgi:hypothetical protein
MDGGHRISALLPRWIFSDGLKCAKSDMVARRKSAKLAASDGDVMISTLEYSKSFTDSAPHLRSERTVQPIPELALPTRAPRVRHCATSSESAPPRCRNSRQREIVAGADDG